MGKIENFIFICSCVDILVVDIDDEEHSPASLQSTPSTSRIDSPSDSSRWPKRQKKHNAVDESFVDLTKAIQNHLCQTSNVPDDDSDSLFGKFIAAELKKKDVITKDRLSH